MNPRSPHPVLPMLHAHPLVAILRGVSPPEVLDVAAVLMEAGVRAIEVPLNSPDPFDSLQRLAKRYGADALIGAGTVLTVDDVDRVAHAGARLVLAPNFNPQVVRQALSQGLLAMPGVATATEAFGALAAGAHALKLFPADVLGVATVKAWRAVLPAHTDLFAVGGMDAGNLRAFKQAGVAGAGIGSALYRPGIALEDLRRRAVAALAAWREGDTPVC